MPEDYDTGTKPPFHQRRYLVDKKFQLKYTLSVTAVSAIIFWVLGVLLYRKTLVATEILRIENLDVAGLVESQDRQILYLLIGVFILQVSSLFVLGILITHRIAGPFHRVRRYLKELSESGELKPLQPMRGRDEFPEFFDALNALLDKLRAGTNEQQTKIRELTEALDRGDVAKARQLVHELHLLLKF